MGHYLYHPGGISCLLVKEGWCWWNRKYAIGETELEGLENEAREAKKGL
jgi:micrococcal nuclease